MVKTGQEEALLKGEKKGELELVKKLIKQNILTDEQIAQVANIPLEEIQRIRKSLSK